ncbi:MAG: tyrosine-type recombinase/integrase [Maridesulfovibrio ferrireducens]|nr:tyrosine-type recombinase/integrase [Maridesulfovibrio ferrireducens]MBI9110651.1 tyrosine-type recombinase/integrase [Maridesulfovibrio ferrireducens]
MLNTIIIKFNYLKRKQSRKHRIAACSRNIKTEELTPRQLSSLMEAIETSSNKPAANMTLMALYTGMRKGEIFKLRWNDIDFNRGFITLKDPKDGTDQRIHFPR